VDIDTSRRVIAGDWCKELAPGGPYFTVSYQQSGVNLPEVETLVYLGSTQAEDEVGQPQTLFMFQLAYSYQEDGNWIELPEERRNELSADAAVVFYAEDSLGGIADIDGVLVLLGGLRERMRRGLGWDRFLPDER
jgi:hypothetical protein